jgi:hypothetical protein
VSTWIEFESEKAFRRATRGRRRAELMRRLRRACAECGRLAVACSTTPSAERGVREIPLDAITATIEPNRAHQFDRDFRPAPVTRTRWQRVWMAMNAGAALPPISVVRDGDRYAVRDGHHRVSVAKWTGAATISAVVA